jgi:hypothetical protein
MLDLNRLLLTDLQIWITLGAAAACVGVLLPRRSSRPASIAWRERRYVSPLITRRAHPRG